MAVRARAIITSLLAFGLVSCAAQTVYNVGGDGGWTFHPNSTFYDDQFENITLYVGDGLSFNFPVGQQDVIEVLPEAVASCDASAALKSSTGPIVIYSSTPGTVGFISSFAGHCSQFGMHLTVTFQTPESPAPSPQPGLDGRGGYNNHPEGRGGYNNHPNGRGGYNDQPNGRGGYNNHPNGRGGYNDQPNGRGGYNNQPNGRGGYNNQPDGRGGYNNQPDGRGGYNNHPDSGGGSN